MVRSWTEELDAVGGRIASASPVRRCASGCGPICALTQILCETLSNALPTNGYNSFPDVCIVVSDTKLKLAISGGRKWREPAIRS